MNDPRLLRVFGVLYGLLALMDFSKPLKVTAEVGLVFFGRRLDGVANLIVAPLFGLLLAVYAYGIWTRRAYALPLGIGYAAYVLTNLALFPILSPAEAAHNSLYGMLYVLAASSVSLLAAAALWRQRDALV